MNLLGPKPNDIKPKALSSRDLQTLLSQSHVGLEAWLIALAHFGHPRLSRVGDGWYCTIEMHVSSTGVVFTIQSEFNCTSPMMAVRQCAERMIAALEKQ